MTAVHDRLASFREHTGQPTEAMISSDIARGHTARGRQRRRRAAVATGGLTVSFGLALGALAVLQPGATSPDPSVATSQRPDGHRVELVSYDGEQLTGFEVTKVPEGFVLQGSSPWALTIARAGDTTDPSYYFGKLAVMLQSEDAPQGLRAGESFTVQGQPATLRRVPAWPDVKGGSVSIDGTKDAPQPGPDVPEGPDHVNILSYLDNGRVVDVQDATGLLTDEQLVEFAEGITVTEDVQPSYG
jgi:hypothetical protein